MNGMRLWALISWVAALFLAGDLLLRGGLIPGTLNYDHYGELRLITLLFFMHAISFSLVLHVLKKLVKEPPLPPPPKDGSDPWDSPLG